jgi:hypothetical protein
VPRITAVSFGALPAMVMLPTPLAAILSWSTAALPTEAEPEPWTARSKLRPLTLSIASDPEPLSQAAVRSWVPTATSTGPVGWPG